jgi:hypothetical protein
LLASPDLEWKITYVGSAEDESRDQILEEVLVGPVPVGTNKFVFQVRPRSAFVARSVCLEAGAHATWRL